MKREIFEIVYERIVDIFVLWLYIYVNISRLWLLDMENIGMLHLVSEQFILRMT